MGGIKGPENTPVWVDESRCKACDICVSVCPAGVLSMEYEPTSTLGAIVHVIHPEACTGCTNCELNCPDFAIYVAEKGDLQDGFSKLTPEAKDRQATIAANNFRMPKA